jgi:hypothetical protein
MKQHSHLFYLFEHVCFQGVATLICRLFCKKNFIRTMSFAEFIMDVAYMDVGSWFNILQLMRF